MRFSQRVHSISLFSLGALTCAHALLLFSVVARNRDVLVVLALLLFSLAFNTMILSVVARQWVGSRITCWIGLLRLILCLTILGPIVQDAKHVCFGVAILIVVTGLLEAFIWVQMRPEHSGMVLAGITAVANILLGAYALFAYSWQSEGTIVVVFGLSLATSSVGPINAGFLVWRTETLAVSVLRNAVEAPAYAVPTDLGSLTKLAEGLAVASTERTSLDVMSAAAAFEASPAPQLRFPPADLDGAGTAVTGEDRRM